MENKDIKLKYSETFFSAQGEGHYTGIPSVWIRFFACNLQCNGFGQTDPTDPSTYELPYETIDISDITSVEDLPVFDRGCDSSYSWSRRYRHLITERTVSDAVDELEALLPTGGFRHSKTGQWNHLVMTGGEPMLKITQPGIVAMMDELRSRDNMPRFVTVETNGTQPLTPDMEEFLDLFHLSSEFGGYVHDHLGDPEWFWSVSPKLWTTSGEPRKRAIRPDVVGKYAELSPHGQLKYVVNGSQETWQEVEEVTQMFRDAGCHFPVWIMPEGATEETQMGVDRNITAGDIAHEAVRRGYNIAPRVHVYLWGNTIGV